MPIVNRRRRCCLPLRAIIRLMRSTPTASEPNKTQQKGQAHASQTGKQNLETKVQSPHPQPPPHRPQRPIEPSPPPHPTKTNNKNKTSESPGHPSQSPPTTHGGEPLLEAITEKEKPMLESVPDRLQLGHSWTTPSGTTKDQKESCLRQRYTADTHKPTDPQGRP